MTYNQDSLTITLNRDVESSDYKVYHLFKAKHFIVVFDVFAKFDKEIPILSFKEVKAKILKYQKKTRFIFYSKKKTRINFANKLNKIFVVIFDKKIEKEVKKEKTTSPHKVKKKIKNTPKVYYKKEYKYKIVVIDPGHGGKDSGAIGYKKRKEKNLVLKIAKLLKKELTKRGFIVFLTREKDRFLELKERTKIANSYNADIFISIHANSVSPFKKNRKKKYGFETYFLSDSRSEEAKDVAELENKAYINQMKYYTKNMFLSLLDREKQIASNKLAIDLQKGVLARLSTTKFKVRDGGVRKAPFWVLVGTLMPSVLVEVGYLSNKKEADRLFTPSYQKFLVKGLADGVESYFQKNR